MFSETERIDTGCRQFRKNQGVAALIPDQDIFQFEFSQNADFDAPNRNVGI